MPTAYACVEGTVHLKESDFQIPMFSLVHCRKIKGPDHCVYFMACVIGFTFARRSLEVPDPLGGGGGDI